MVRTKEETKIFMETLCARFSAFVQDAVDQGMADDFVDHMEFIDAAFNVFKDLEASDEDEYFKINPETGAIT
jgi:hypothetical protein